MASDGTPLTALQLEEKQRELAAAEEKLAAALSSVDEEQAVTRGVLQEAQGRGLLVDQLQRELAAAMAEVEVHEQQHAEHTRYGIFPGSCQVVDWSGRPHHFVGIGGPGNLTAGGHCRAAEEWEKQTAALRSELEAVAREEAAAKSGREVRSHILTASSAFVQYQEAQYNAPRAAHS